MLRQNLYNVFHERRWNVAVFSKKKKQNLKFICEIWKESQQK